MQALILLVAGVLILLAVVAVCRKGRPPRPPKPKGDDETVEYMMFYD